MGKVIQSVCVAAIVAALGVGTAVGDLGWDPGNDGLGGVGNWNTTDLNWDNTPPSDTDVNVEWTGGENAVFETGSGVVTINQGGAIDVNTIVFNSPDGPYTIDAAGAGDSLKLPGQEITAITDATINARMTAGSITKFGAGTLTLNDITGLEGGIFPNGGTLILGDPAGLPGGVLGVWFGSDSTLANGSGGLMDWRGKTIVVNGNFRIGAGDAMRFLHIDPGADNRAVIIDNATEVYGFTANRSNVVFGGSGTMTLTGGNSSFYGNVYLKDDLTVVLNGTGADMLDEKLHVHDNATLRLDTDDQLGITDIRLYDSSTLDVNSRTETIKRIFLESSDARIILTTGSLTVESINAAVFGGATIDTGTSGILTILRDFTCNNSGDDSDTTTIGGSGTVSHSGDSMWKVYDNLADIDLRIDARITGNGTTSDGQLTLRGWGNNQSRTVLLTNPNNDFAMKLQSLTVLLGTVGAGGTSEIELAGYGYLGVAAGNSISLSNDIKLTGIASNDGLPGFTGEGNVTVTGRVNTGATSRNLHLTNTGLVTLSGKIGNFDDATVHELLFTGDGTIVLTNPANDYSLKVDGATVLLGASGAGGVGEIQMQSGRLGASTGTNLTLGNDIKLTHSGGFAGDGTLTVAGRINTGSSNPTLTLDNIGLVTISGGMGNFDTADIRTLTFKGTGDMTVAIPGNPINNVSLNWNSTGTLTFSGPQQLAGDFWVYDGSTVLAGNQMVSGRCYLQSGASMDVIGDQTLGSYLFVDNASLTVDGNQTMSGRLTMRTGSSVEVTGDQAVGEYLFLRDASLMVGGSQTVSGKFEFYSGSSVEVNGNQTIGGDFIVQQGGSVAIGGTQQIGGRVSVESGTFTLNGGTLVSTGRVTAESGSQIVLNDTQVTAPTVQIDPGASLSGYGTVTGKIATSAGTIITADGGRLTLGDASQFAAFNHQGEMHAGAAEIALRTKGFASLGPLTTVTGGTLSADNGIVIGPGSSVFGFGSVDAKISSGFGSTIEASGDMALGDANSYDGFYSDGSLVSGAHTVTINDRNQAVLGSLTEMGTDIADGTLVADNGLLVEFGKNVIGRGTIDTPNDELTPLTNNGTIIGDFPGDIELTGYVKGVGTLENVTVSGTLSPGFSPVRLHAINLEIAANGELLMELGGLSGGSEYDQLDVAGELHLGGTLQVSLIDGFVPGVGDTFDILDFSDLNGTEFDVLELPELAGRNIWDTSGLYTSGLLVVAEIMAGDTDGDWDVDVTDYQSFVGAFGGAGDWRTDFNGDGRTDLADFVLLRGSFGLGVASAPDAAFGATTPEPATLTLLAFGGIVLVRRRKRGLCVTATEKG
jgi:hypothetical protein